MIPASVLKVSRILLCFLALPLVAFCPVGPQAVRAQSEGESRLTFGVTGNVTGQGVADPGFLLRHPEVQDLVLQLAKGSMTGADVATSLRGTQIKPEHLLATGIVARGDGDTYVLAMNLLTAADQAILERVTRRYGILLADDFMSQASDFEKAGLSAGPSDELVSMLRFVLVGCVVLDWDGLSLTEEMKLRTAATPRDGSGTYTPWAYEIAADRSVRGLDWGSHNMESGPVWFTSFGDHSALPRPAVPDLLWTFGRDRIDTYFGSEVRGALAHGARSGLERAAPLMGRMMLRLRDGRQSHAELKEIPLNPGETTADAELALRFLVALGYVARDGDWIEARVPVLTRLDDDEMIRRVRQVGRRILERWLRAHYAEIRSELSGLSAIRAGVAYEQVFTQVYHHLFGWANYQLSRRGWMTDPYGPLTRFTGFVPFVWDAELQLNQ